MDKSVVVDKGRVWLTPESGPESPPLLYVLGLEFDGSSLGSFYLTPKQALELAAHLVEFAATNMA